MNTERKALSWLFVIIAVVLLALLLYSAGNAQSVTIQREWLLEYEEVSGYPAPVEEPTAVYDIGYPAPPVEPTATKKPKISAITSNPPRPTPTLAPTRDVKPKDQECISEASDEWWREKRKGQAWFITKNGVTTYCFGYPPIPFYEGTPDPPREGDILTPTNEAGYPAPESEPTQTDDPGNGYPAPGE